MLYKIKKFSSLTLITRGYRTFEVHGKYKLLKSLLIQ